MPSGEDGVVLRYRSVGTQTFEAPAVVSPAFPEGGEGQFSSQSAPQPPGPSIPRLVASVVSLTGVQFLRPRQTDSDDRCESPRMGSSLGQPGGSGTVVAPGTIGQYQSPGVAGDQTGSLPVPTGNSRSTRSGVNGQYLGKSPRQQGGGHEIPHPDVRSGSPVRLGGETSPVNQSGPYLGLDQYHGGLAQPRDNRSGRVAASPSSLPRAQSALRDARGGPVCDPGQCAASPLYVQIPVTAGGGPRRSPLQMAQGAFIRVPPDAAPSTSHQETASGEGRDSTGGPKLAPETVVRRSHSPLSGPTVGDPTPPRGAVPGGSQASRPPVAPISRLALERDILKRVCIPATVVSTIQAARRPSTTRIYEASWQAFCRWAASQRVNPASAAIQDVLQFLQAGLDKGLAPATLRRQTAALSTVISCPPYQSLSHHPLIRGFLHGAANLRPPAVHRYPSWDLPLVLRALTGPPFEPLDSALLKHLSFKVAFLLAITSARRVSEIAALSVRKDLCIFREATVVLRLDPAFLPKVNSWFHRAQELVLPDFCPSPSNDKERSWHSLDVRRALRIYIRRTAPFRRSEALLVSFNPSSMGQKVSSATVSRWIKACISMAYELNDRPIPGRILPHSTRSAATTAAWATQASVVDICRAATWSNLTSFIRHYKIDSYDSAEASFGRRVLQRVMAEDPPGGSQFPTHGT